MRTGANFFEHAVRGAEHKSLRFGIPQVLHWSGSIAIFPVGDSEYFNY